MANSKVSLRDVYEITNRIEDKLDKMESRVSALEIWKAEMMGKMAIIVGAVTLVFTMAWDYARKKLNL